MKIFKSKTKLCSVCGNDPEDGNLNDEQQWEKNRNICKCSEVECQGPGTTHSDCTICGARTCVRGLIIDINTLQRRILPKCASCKESDLSVMRDARRLKDWKELTDPIDNSKLRMGLLPEQYPSISRKTLRAFINADVKNAVVEGTTSGALNATIKSLGLQKQVYAEDRGNEVVLRKIEKAKSNA